MGASVDQSAGSVTVVGAEPTAAKDVVNVENSGTTLRFMTSVFTLPERGYTILTGDASIRRRPMQALLDGLQGLGGRVLSSTGNGCAPIVVGEGGLEGGKVNIRGDVSSQFVSSILISAPLARRDSSIQVLGMVSRPYVEATLSLSKSHGIEIEKRGSNSFEIPGGQEYKPFDFSVPGDFSSASFVMAAVALIGGKVELSGLTLSPPQGDSVIMDVLERMGVGVDQHPNSIVVQADGEELSGGSFDLSDTPDLLPVLSILSLNSSGPVVISGVAHARFKETDRIKATVEGLRNLGAKVQERHDGMTIHKPKRLVPATLDAHDDHRMFMAFSLASLLAPRETRVIGAESVDVSYPSFLRDMEQIGVEVVRE
jgi:3-phosphoshikimate 1-carboxyvinyltransferase